MFLFGDISKTTQLLHSSDIGELMAEPPVAGGARRQVRETARESATRKTAFARLLPSPEIDAPVTRPPAGMRPRDRERAAA